MPTAQKAAIVTGACRRMGAGILEAFLSRDHQVVANSRRTTLVGHANEDAKEAVHAMLNGGPDAAMRALPIEYATDCIRVNTVAAGVIDTLMHGPKAHDSHKSLHPMHKWGKSRKSSTPLLFLTYLAFTSAEILRVNGGAHTSRW